MVMSNSTKMVIGAIFVAAIVAIGIFVVKKTAEKNQTIQPQPSQSSQPSQPGQQRQAPPVLPKRVQTSTVELLDSDKAAQDNLLDDAVVMVFADWCSHCKTAIPEFFKAATQSSVPFFAINGPKCPQTSAALGVKAYPMIIRLRPGSDPQVFKGNRKAESFVKFAQ